MDDRPVIAGKPQARRRKRVWLVAAIISLAAIVVCILGAAAFWPKSHSADDRLAEIEAARAIPDSENAAMIYNELLRDSKATSLSDASSQAGEPLLSDRVLHGPWLSRDQPETDAWLKEHRYIIDRLLEAARFEKCRFPISIDIRDTSSMDRAAPMRWWGFLLRAAANNDIAEGRLDAAMVKWQCLLRIGDHLLQQPVPTDHFVGSSIQRLALEGMARFILEDDPTDAHLRRLEAMPLPIADGTARDIQEIREVSRLKEQRMMEGLGPLDRISAHIFRYRFNHAVFGTLKGPDTDETTRQADLRCIATGRGIRTLIAMKRYRSTTGHWPTSLNEIKASLPEEVLTDPLNCGPFVYKPAADVFSLYSKGRNSIDENGQHDPNGPDDWPIWPSRGRDPEAGQQDTNE